MIGGSLCGYKSEVMKDKTLILKISRAQDLSLDDFLTITKEGTWLHWEPPVCSNCLHRRWLLEDYSNS